MIKLLMLFSFSAFAADWRIDGGDKSFWLKDDCEQEYSKPCYDFTGKDPQYHDVVGDRIVLNQTKKDAVDAAKQSKEAAKAIAEQKKLDAKEKLKSAENANSVAALREQIQAIKDYLGLE